MTPIDKYIERLSGAEQERIRYFLSDLRLCGFGGDKFTFLDIGAGTGIMSLGVLLKFENALGTLVDFKNSLLFPEEISGSLSKRFRFVQCKDIVDISDERFDLVISIDVLEHIFNWRSAFVNLSGYLAVGGYLYIQVPSNYPSLNFPRLEVYKQLALGFMGKNNPNRHLRHGLSCKQLFDEAKRMGLKPLLAAEDYVLDSVVHCDFKPRCHCLFQKQ